MRLITAFSLLTVIFLLISCSQTQQPSISEKITGQWEYVYLDYYRGYKFEYTANLELFRDNTFSVKLKLSPTQLVPDNKTNDLLETDKSCMGYGKWIVLDDKPNKEIYEYRIKLALNEGELKRLNEPPCSHLWGIGFGNEPVILGVVSFYKGLEIRFKIPSHFSPERIYHKVSDSTFR
jgi:hypothetical protein